ncbi:MAG: DUF1684 domain-containing protein [bacterium]
MNKYIMLFLIAGLLFSCQEEKAKVDSAISNKYDDYFRLLDESRKNGYLQLCGLHRLNDTMVNSVGLDSSNSIQIAIPTIAETIGNISFGDETVLFETVNNAKVINANDSLITSISSSMGKYGSDVQLYHDRIKFQVITRSGLHFLRVWDSLNPAIAAFNGFQKYPPNEDFVIQADFKYYDEILEKEVESKLGVNTNTNFIGKVSFSYLDKAYELEVGTSGFLMIADKTSGSETYGGGRYVYIDLPETDGRVEIDFNKLYNPPCSYSEFTTCLVPPKSNHLDFEVTAGELLKMNKTE